MVYALETYLPINCFNKIDVNLTLKLVAVFVVKSIQLNLTTLYVVSLLCERENMLHLVWFSIQ